MSPMYSLVVTLFFSFFLILQSTTNAFNITEILNPYIQFSKFNSQLSQTGVASEINNQKAVTVLVVANDCLRSFTYLPGNDVKRILSFHVILEYYDESKLKSLQSRTSLTTLYQQATLTVHHESNGPITFRSAGASPNMDVCLLATIETQPPSISVLQIASTITIDARSSTPQKPPVTSPNTKPHPPTASAASPPRKALAPAPSHNEKSPPTSPNKPSNAPASSPTKPSNNAPSASRTKPSNAPSETPSEPNPAMPPHASPPRKALAPVSSNDESPAASPPKPSNTPAAAADVPTPGSDKKSSAAPVSCGNYLSSILTIFTSARFLFTMI